MAIIKLSLKNSKAPLGNTPLGIYDMEILLFCSYTECNVYLSVVLIHLFISFIVNYGIFGKINES